MKQLRMPLPQTHTWSPCFGHKKKRSDGMEISGKGPFSTMANKKIKNQYIEDTDVCSLSRRACSDVKPLERRQAGALPGSPTRGLPLMRSPRSVSAPRFAISKLDLFAFVVYREELFSWIDSHLSSS